MTLVENIKRSLHNPKVHVPIYLLLAVLSGALAMYTYPPYNYVAYVVVPYLLLFWLIYRYPPTTIFWVAFAYGCGEFFRGMFWVYSFGSWVDPQYLYSVIIINTIILILLALFGAAFPALFVSLWFKYLGKRFGVFVLVLIFITFEWIRSFLFTGLPYFQPGLLFVDTPLANLAPLSGSLSVTFVFFLLIALLFCLLHTKLIIRRVQAIIAMVVIVSFTVLLGQFEFSKSGEPLAVRVVHGAQSNADKEVSYKQADRIKRYVEFTKQASAPDLVVWPEGTVQGGNRLLGRVLKHAKKIKQSQGTDIVLGAYVADKEGRGYNALIRGDNLRTLYNKVHLIPFGEYTPDLGIPFLNIGEHLPSVSNDSLTKGDKNQLVAETGNTRLRAGICFEVIFGDDIRRTEADYDIFVNISDLAWFTGTPVKYHTLQMARMRAMEISKAMLRSTNYGVSGIIDHKGKVLAAIDNEESGFADATITKQQGLTPYIRFGDWPLMVLVFAGLGLIFVINLVRLRSSQEREI